MTGIECKWGSGISLFAWCLKSLYLLPSTGSKASCTLIRTLRTWQFWYSQSLVVGDAVRHVVVAATEHPTQLRLCFCYTVQHLETKMEFSSLQEAGCHHLGNWVNKWQTYSWQALAKVLLHSLSLTTSLWGRFFGEHVLDAASFSSPVDWNGQL